MGLVEAGRQPVLHVRPGLDGLVLGVEVGQLRPAA
jgi:hypothetical protein